MGLGISNVVTHLQQILPPSIQMSAVTQLCEPLSEATCRGAFHDVLSKAGAPRSYFEFDDYGEPVATITGGIARLGSTVIALATRAPDVRAIGVECVDNNADVGPLTDYLFSERECMLAEVVEPWTARGIYCAKESAIKAAHALTGRWLDYTQIEVLSDGQSEQFYLRAHSNISALQTASLKTWMTRPSPRGDTTGIGAVTVIF